VDPIEQIAQGAIAFLWPQTDHVPSYEGDDILRGFVQRNDEDGTVNVRGLDETVLEEGPLFGLPGKSPTCLLAATEYGGALVANIVGRNNTHGFGGGRASVRRFRAHTLLAPVDIASLASTKVFQVSAYFKEGLRWSGQGALAEEWELDAEHRITRVKYLLEGSAPPLHAGDYGSLRVEIEPHWRSSGTAQSHSITIDTALEVRVIAGKPRPIEDFIPPLLGIQDLMSLAHDQLIPASSGKVLLHSAGRPDAAAATLWQKDLMVPPPRPKPSANVDSEALISMEDIGGPGALSRWLRLTDRVPDPVAAVTSIYRRQGALGPALRLQELAASIENYVNLARTDREVSWAKKGNSDSHAHALAQRVGAPFREFVGDPKLWAQRFREANNGLKHDPKFPRDQRELRLLAGSGNLLLVAALLKPNCELGWAGEENLQRLSHPRDGRSSQVRGPRSLANPPLCGRVVADGIAGIGISRRTHIHCGRRTAALARGVLAPV
jgi:hypothetical protein